MHSLGRVVEHDPRSLAYSAERSPQLVTTLHQRIAPILDQGQLGSCTGNAMAGLLGTQPFAGILPVNEALAVRLYEAATRLDNVPGHYPPDDTGSSGLAVAKAAQRLGLIKSYRHAFGLAHALGALVIAPVIIGINWYDSFDAPGAGGLIAISPNAQVRGGHEVELIGLDVTAGTVRGCNSWGTAWGDQGQFTMTWRTFDQLLHEHGDVTTVA